MSNKKLNIFSYNDFRCFLADFFAHHRRKMNAWTIRSFAQRAGIPSHSYISAVIKGKRNLTRSTKQKILKTLGLEPNEQNYFSLLVDFNQAIHADDKQEIFERLNGLRRNTVYYRLNKAHFEYLSKWYHLVIRELAVYARWDGDYARLASLVNPPITPTEAKNAVKILLETGLLAQREDGGYVQTEKIITTKEMPGHLVRKARRQLIELAARASDTIDPNVRNLGSATIMLNRKNYGKAVEILEEARGKIVALAQDDDAAHRVYQAHLHLFPVSETIDPAEAP